MQIPINKDIEEAYRDEVMKGFSLRELVAVAVSGVLVVGIAAFAWWKFQMSPDIGVFIGIPFAIPVILAGFKKYQGLTAMQYAKEILYEYQTRVLVYDADELPPDVGKIFSMQRNGAKRERSAWRK